MEYISVNTALHTLSHSSCNFSSRVPSAPSIERTYVHHPCTARPELLPHQNGARTFSALITLLAPFTKVPRSLTVSIYRLLLPAQAASTVVKQVDFLLHIDRSPNALECPAYTCPSEDPFPFNTTNMHSLLTLSPELRLRIYQHYLSDLELTLYEHWIDHGERSEPRIQYFTPPKPGAYFTGTNPQFPNLVYASRRIRAELLPLLPSLVPLVFREMDVEDMKTLLSGVPEGFMRRVERLVVSEELVEREGEVLTEFIVPRLTGLSVVSWEHVCGLLNDDFVTCDEEKPQSGDWRDEGPVRLLVEGMDEGNGFKAVEVALRKRLGSIVPVGVRGIVCEVLRMGVQVEVRQGVVDYYPPDSDAKSWGEVWLEQVLVSGAIPLFQCDVKREFLLTGLCTRIMSQSCPL